MAELNNLKTKLRTKLLFKVKDKSILLVTYTMYS